MTFLVLASRRGRSIDPARIEHLARTGDREAPFVPDESLTWTSGNGRVRLIAWQAFTEQAGIGSHWHLTDGGVIAFTGHCWPLEAGWAQVGPSWAAQLDCWMGDHPAIEVVDRLFGHFDLIKLDADGRGEIATDFLSAGPLYLAEDDDFTALSNRAGLAALAVSSEGVAPTRSPLGVGWLVFTGLMFDEETGYLDVEHLPVGASVQIDPENGARIEHAERPAVNAAPGELPNTFEELAPLMAAEAMQTMRILARLPADQIQLWLSGGKDSRLLTAAIIAAGLTDRFDFVTFGAPGKSDPRVAAQIAQTFQLKWQLEDRRGRSAEADLAMVATHTWLVEAMCSGWNTTSDLVAASLVSLTGVGGDYIGWLKEASAGLNSRTRADIMAQIAGRRDFDRFGLLLPEARAYYLETFGEWVDRRLGMGIPPPEVRSYLLREAKIRGAIGPARAVQANLWVSPFVTPIWFRASYQVPFDERPGNRFHIDVIELLCPKLLDIPLAGADWSPQSYAHRPDGARFAALKGVVGDGRDALNWRVVNWETYRPALESRLLDRANPIYQVLDYNQVERTLRKPPDPGRLRFLYSALTGALWLTNAEDRTRIARLATPG